MLQIWELNWGYIKWHSVAWYEGEQIYFYWFENKHAVDIVCDPEDDIDFKLDSLEYLC